MTQQLDLASAARIAAIVIAEEEGQRKFAAFLCRLVPSVWENGLKDWKPPRHASLASLGADPFDDFVKAGRKLAAAIKALHADHREYVGLLLGNNDFDKLEDQLQRVLLIVDAVYLKKIGRPSQPFKDGFEVFVGRVLLKITRLGVPRPTCNRHHQSGTLVDLLVALRPYLPLNFVPEHFDKWPWAKLERILSAKNLREVFAVCRNSLPI